MLRLKTYLQLQRAARSASMCRAFVSSSEEMMMSNLVPKHPEMLAEALDELAAPEKMRARIADLEAALRGIIHHWNEFGEMMGVKDDYGFSERLDAAEKLIR